VTNTIAYLLRATTLSIMTLSITTLSITTLSIMTLSIMTLNITALSIRANLWHSACKTLGVNETYHNSTTIMPGIIILSVTFYL
jgi:hypothetical protein